MQERINTNFVHEGCQLVDPAEIVNAFNVYFANIDKNLPSKIKQDDYKLQTIFKIASSGNTVIQTYHQKHYY